MTQEGSLPPPVLWAQRKDVVFLTICLEDCKDPQLKVESDKIYFKGVGGTERKLHEVVINLYGVIDADKTEKGLKGRNIELVLMKKEEGPYWPRLTKEQQKFHYLKSDFNKWKDEDDSEDEAVLDGNNKGLEEMMRQMGGLGGGGGLGGSSMGAYEDEDDMGLDDADSDDDEIPELEDSNAVASEKPKVQS